MRLLILCGLFCLGLVTSSSADEVDIQTVIDNQIDAFLSDDFATAFTYASPNIKRVFGNPERFGQMVRQGYPMVWRPQNVEYLSLNQINGRHVQTVMITDNTGTIHLLEYDMIDTPEGWLINGVQILRTPQIGA